MSVSAGARLRHRLSGDYLVDPWGLDLDLLDLVSPLVGARWRVSTEHADLLPTTGPALLVFNRRLGLSEPLVLARGVRLAAGRVVRTVGVPDIAPIGPMLRRLGGVLDRTDEIAGLLRAGELVSVPLRRVVRTSRRAGALPTEILEPALSTGAPVVPVAVVGRETGRTWRVIVGPPLDVRSVGGPLAAAELAESLQRQLQDLLHRATSPRHAEPSR